MTEVFNGSTAQRINSSWGCALGIRGGRERSRNFVYLTNFRLNSTPPVL